MPRALTSEEALTVAAKAKESRPYVYNSSTGALEQISKDFEAFLILSSAGVKSRAAQFIATILLFDINNLVVRNNLTKRWIDDEYSDLDTEIEGYQDILDVYDEIRPDLADATSGFEDVLEVNTLLEGIHLLLGDFAEQRDSLKYSKAIANVFKLKEQGTVPSELKREIESYSRALLSYD